MVIITVNVQSSYTEYHNYNCITTLNIIIIMMTKCACTSFKSVNDATCTDMHDMVCDVG